LEQTRRKGSWAGGLTKRYGGKKEVVWGVRKGTLQSGETADSEGAHSKGEGFLRMLTEGGRKRGRIIEIWCGERLNIGEER